MADGATSGDSRPVIKLSDGNEYRVNPLTLGMMGKLEDKFGQSFSKIMSDPWAKHIIYIMFLSLSDYPNLNEQKIADMATPETIKDFVSKVIA